MAGVIESGTNGGSGASLVLDAFGSNNSIILQVNRLNIANISAGGVNINGVLSAQVKNFSIPYPGNATKLLVHSSVEGPEIAVFYRGTAQLAAGTATDYVAFVLTPNHRKGRFSSQPSTRPRGRPSATSRHPSSRTVSSPSSLRIRTTPPRRSIGRLRPFDPTSRTLFAVFRFLLRFRRRWMFRCRPLTTPPPPTPHRRHPSPHLRRHHARQPAANRREPCPELTVTEKIAAQSPNRKVQPRAKADSRRAAGIQAHRLRDCFSSPWLPPERGYASARSRSGTGRRRTHCRTRPPPRPIAARNHRPPRAAIFCLRRRLWLT